MAQDPSPQPDTHKSLQEQLDEERTLRHFTERVLDCRQRELEVAEADNARLLRKLEQLARETLDLKAQLRAHGNRSPPHHNHTGDHTTSRPHPPRPLPPQDLTETEAREAYKALCGKVQRWVESRLPEMRDAVAAGQAKKPPAQQAARFLSLLREPGKRCLAVSGGEEYHVVAAIMYYLWLGLFSKPFYCPLEEGFEEATMGWILGMEAAMGKTRDVERCREWRSETLTALCSQKSFRSRRDAYLHLLAKDLASYLAVLLPKIPTLELQISLHKAIVQPAADLAHGLHTSINFFWLKWPLKTASSRLEVYECTNLADGGRTMDLSGTSPESAVRRHTKYLFDIAPGLFVERVEGGKKMTLRSICRPKVLIHAGESSVPHKATLMTWLYNATTC
ncbi:hypothetical protein E4U50_004548 [Claviceps purpurea]|nr:hypothetical protein E4U50_004548 [Claviceps purpurea]